MFRLRVYMPMVTGFKMTARIAFAIILFTALASVAFAEENPANDSCFVCHSNPDLEMTFPSGETVSVYVDRSVYASSVHGILSVSCASCHTDITDYPHREHRELSYRDYSLDLYPVCIECHSSQIAEINGNVHMVALDAGNPAAAVCTDCHGNHGIQDVTSGLTMMNRTCGKCHGEINTLYEESAHGAALIGDGNSDVPSCTDCHGAHEIIGPSNSPFHLFSPQICGECHSDRSLMEKYGINPNVMDSYVSDFHGKTIIIFENIASDQETNKPVCIDCHGVHDILPPSDTHSSVMKENLLVTCRKCHPNASTNFPDSWLSHYNPGPDQFRPVFLVQVIYSIWIPLFLILALIYVFSDYYRQRKALKGGK